MDELFVGEKAVFYLLTYSFILFSFDGEPSNSVSDPEEYGVFLENPVFLLRLIGVKRRDAEDLNSTRIDDGIDATVISQTYRVSGRPCARDFIFGCKNPLFWVHGVRYDGAWSEADASNPPN